MNVRTFAVAAGMVTLAVLPFAAQAPNTTDINAKIRQEAMNNSQIMRTLHYLSDVYGPRLTGSPNHKAAAEWAVKQMTTWGFTNGHLEPWDFGREGWLNEYLAVHVTAPFKDALVVEALGWTPGTHGKVNAKAFNLIVPEGPEAPASPNAPAARGTRRRPRAGAARSDAGRAHRLFRERQEQGGGRRRAGRQADLRARQPEPGRRAPHRRTGQLPLRRERRQRCRNAPTARGGFGQRGGGAPAGRGAATADATPDHGAGRRAGRQVPGRQQGGAADQRRRRGRTARSSPSTTARYDITKAVPTVVMRNEDYGRIARILADGTPVELEADDRQQDLSGRQDVLQHDRGDRRHRQEGRSRHARRPPRFVALRHRRHRQRDRLRDHDGSGAHPEGASASSRAARSASRCGAARRRACSGRWPT